MAKVLIRQVMKEKGIKVNRLVPFLSISRSTLYNIMSGRKSPTLEELEEIAYVMNVPIGSLYEVERGEK